MNIALAKLGEKFLTAYKSKNLLRIGTTWISHFLSNGAFKCHLSTTPT